MTWLQYASRHVHHTVANYVLEHLTALKWTVDDQTPFGAAKVSMIRTSPIANDALDKDIRPGVVACTLGDEAPPVLEELGGPLSIQEYPIFFDVFQDSEATALNLANDIADILRGRLPDTHRWLPVINQATNAAVAGWHIELEDVERVLPERRFPMHWQVVKVTAETHFPEVNP